MERTNRRKTGKPPNVRVRLWRSSRVLKTDNDAFPGVVDLGSIEDATDERLREHPLLRHSSLFTLTQTYRDNVRRTCGAFCEEKKPDENAQDDAQITELYFDGHLSVNEKGKTLRFGTENLLTVQNGAAFWRTGDPLLPELIFRQGERFALGSFPPLDIFLRMGIAPELPQRSCFTKAMRDTLTETGGEFAVEYVVEIGGCEVEDTRLSLRVFPMEKDTAKPHTKAAPAKNRTGSAVRAKPSRKQSKGMEQT